MRKSHTGAETTALGYGQRIPATGTGGTVAAVAPDGRLVALVEDAGSTARVTVGFPAPPVARSGA